MACHGRIMILGDRQPSLTVGVTYGFHNMSKYKEHPERCFKSGNLLENGNKNR